MVGGSRRLSVTVTRARRLNTPIDKAGSAVTFVGEAPTGWRLPALGIIGVLLVAGAFHYRKHARRTGTSTLVAAEMVAANVGLGQMVLNASNFLRTDIVVMGIIVIGVVAYMFDLLMSWIEDKLVPWKGRV